MSTQHPQNPHYDSNGRPLVPPAERAFIPVQDLESAQETVWFNPTAKDAKLDLYIGVTPCRSKHAREQFQRLPPLQKKEFRTGIRTYIIRAGERRSIHSDFDQGIQRTECLEPECTSRRLYCRDVTHHQIVIGGLGPQLVNERVLYRYAVHPSLIEAAAREQAEKDEVDKYLKQKKDTEHKLALAEAKVAEASAELARARAIEERVAANAAALAAETERARKAQQDEEERQQAETDVARPARQKR